MRHIYQYLLTPSAACFPASEKHSDTYPSSIVKTGRTNEVEIPNYYDVGVCLDACIDKYMERNFPDCVGVFMPQKFVGRALKTLQEEQCHGAAAGGGGGGGGGRGVVRRRKRGTAGVTKDMGNGKCK